MYLFFFSIKRRRCKKVAHEPDYVYNRNVCLFTFLTILCLNLIIKISVAFFSVSTFGEQIFFKNQKSFEKFSNFFKRYCRNNLLQQFIKTSLSKSLFFSDFSENFKKNRTKFTKNVAYISYLHKINICAIQMISISIIF